MKNKNIKFIEKKNKHNDFMNLMNIWFPISYSQQPNSTTPTTIYLEGIASVQRLWTLVPSTLHVTCGKAIITAPPPITTNKKKATKEPITS